MRNDVVGYTDDPAVPVTPDDPGQGAETGRHKRNPVLDQDQVVGLPSDPETVSDPVERIDRIYGC